MANIKPYTDEIANAVYGEEVRSWYYVKKKYQSN